MKTIKIDTPLHQLLRKKAAETDRNLAASFLQAAFKK
jgi:hypothetical protein